MHFLHSQFSVNLLREARSVRFGGETQGATPESQNKPETTETLDKPEVIIQSAAKRAENAKNDIAQLDQKIQDLSKALDALKVASQEGGTKENAADDIKQNEEEDAQQKNTTNIDVDALLKKYGVEIPLGADTADVVKKAIDDSTKQRGEKTGEIRAAETDRAEAEEDLIQNASPEDRIGIRFNQLTRAKNITEFISGALKAWTEVKMYFANLKEQITGVVSGSKESKGSTREDAVTREIRKKGADAVRTEATASKAAAEKALAGDSSEGGLTKRKETLNGKKAILEGKIISAESSAKDMPNGDEKNKKIAELKEMRGQLKEMEQTLTKVDEGIATQKRIVELSDKKLKRIEEMTEATTKTKDKLQTVATNLLTAISKTDLKANPEATAIQAMLDKAVFEAKGTSILIRETDASELTAARETLTKLGLNPAAVNVEQRDGGLYIKDPTAFATALEGCLGKLQSKNAMSDLKLVKSADGASYVREGYTGKYYQQADGSIFYEGGKGPSGKEVKPQTYVDGKWDDAKNTPDTQTASSVAKIKEENTAANNEKINKAAKDNGLSLRSDGKSYIKEGYSGKYYAQTDGSIFYEGGKGPSGKDTKPQTYVDGKWDAARNTRLV